MPSGAKMTNAEQAMKLIEAIIRNDKDYPHAELKLGAIWSICDVTATYRRVDTTQGVVVIVEMRR